MGGNQLEQKEGPRRIMVNSDEDLIEALKKINETLQVKKKIICKKKGEMNNGRDGQINGTLETEG